MSVPMLCGRDCGIETCRELDEGTEVVAMLRKLNKKCHSYVREILFILRDCVDWRSRITLFVNTVLFHLGNWLKQRRSSQDVAFSAQLKIGPDSR